MKKRIVDLFAGIGGLRKGIEDEIGSEVVLTSEIDSSAVKTYEANFGKSLIVGDIRGLKEEEVPDHEILLAGFPCQTFSIAGLKKGFEDPRGQLFFEVARILRFKKPKVAILENVKHLTRHDEGRTFAKIVETLREIGYKVHYEILNARDFGIPQNRERVYIVCFLEEVPFEFPTAPKSSTRVRDILEKEVDEKYTLTNKQHEYNERRKAAQIEKGNTGFHYRLVHPDQSFVGTLTAHYGKGGTDNLLIQEGKNPRWFTERECARMQGFPDDYKIVVSRRQAYKQFGNSVCIPVIRAIARKIKEII